jgi:hypothetical protein
MEGEGWKEGGRDERNERLKDGLTLNTLSHSPTLELSPALTLALSISLQGLEGYFTASTTS